jgi:hypothetical protein
VPEISDDADSEKQETDDLLSNDDNGMYRIPCLQLMFEIIEKVLNYFASDKKKFEVTISITVYQQ